MDQAALDAFKTRVRLMLLEKLLLRLAFDGAVGAISAAESRERLLDWLDHNSQAADSAYASRFKGDPAQLALYADEVKEVVDGMKTVVEEVYHDWLART